MADPTPSNIEYDADMDSPGTSTTSTTHRDEDGQMIQQTHKVTTTHEDGSSETGWKNTIYGDDGSPVSTGMGRTNRDENGKVESETVSMRNDDGSTTTTTTDAHGNVTTVKRDKDGNIISEKTVDADGNEIDTPKQDNSEFWDADIIYGDHSEPLEDVGGKDGFADLKMMLELDPSLEMYVDQFEFIM